MANKNQKRKTSAEQLGKKYDSSKYRMSFLALERTQGAECLWSDAEVALVLLNRGVTRVYTRRAVQQHLKSAYTGRVKAAIENHLKFVSARHK